MAKATEVAEPAADDKYVWTSPTGARIELTRFDQIPMGVFEDIQDMQEPALTYYVLRHATSEADYEALRASPNGPVKAMFAQWIAASQVTLPES